MTKTMTLEQWASEKQAELLAKGYRQAECVKAEEGTMSRRMTSLAIFTAALLPMSTEILVMDNEELSEKLEVPAAHVTFSVLAPRKRKVDREYYWLPLAPKPHILDINRADVMSKVGKVVATFHGASLVKGIEKNSKGVSLVTLTRMSDNADYCLHLSTWHESIPPEDLTRG